MKTISPEDCLSPGTLVQVGNLRGVVVSSKLVQASNGGNIAVNTIKFCERFRRGFGKNGLWVEIQKPRKPEGISYASIQIVT